MDKSKNLFISGILTAMAIVIVLFAYLRQVQQPREADPIEAAKPTKTASNRTNESYQLSFETIESKWKLGNSYSATLKFKKLPTVIPTVYTVELTYDPSILQLVRVSEGNLWTASNVLQNEIDNKTGKLIFTEGKAFNAEDTLETTLITAEFNVVGSSKNRTEVSVSKTSLSAVGESAYQLIANSLTVAIIK